VDAGNLVGAAIKMFNPTRPRSISGTSSATDQLRSLFIHLEHLVRHRLAGKRCIAIVNVCDATALFRGTTRAVIYFAGGARMAMWPPEASTPRK